MEKKNIIDFFKKKAGTMISIVLSLLLVAFFFNKIFLKEKKAGAKEFIAAKRIFEKKEALSSEMLDRGYALLKKYPELRAQYQGALSLGLAQNEENGESNLLLKEHLKRVENLCPIEYQEFAQNGLLISEGQLEEALKNSLALEEKINNSSSHNRLRLVNLVRIAFLAHEKNDDSLRNETLIKLQNNPLYPALEPLFLRDNFNLITYLMANTNSEK